MEPEKWSETDPIGNYDRLKFLLEIALNNAGRANNLHEAKGFLIEAQSYFKGLKLLREHREELYGRLQEAFAGINRRIDEERLDFEYEALSNYADLKPAVSEALRQASDSADLKEAWESLLMIQDRIKAARLLRENRSELHSTLQQAFETVRVRRDEEKNAWDREAQSNYQRLKHLVEQGLHQAEETHEYKETREFLKKIQSEFRGIKMSHPQREELYSRLQTAFDILGKRLDDYFRNKKKNWAVRMQFNVSRLSADIYELQKSIGQDEANLKELEDQLEIVASSGKEGEAIAGLRARIAFLEKTIEHKREQAALLESEKNGLQERLSEPEKDIQH